MNENNLEIETSYQTFSNESLAMKKSLSQNLEKKGKQRILKNVLSLAFGHCLVFTAFDSLSNLQSTINSKGGVGIASQAVIYAFFTISSFFLPTYIIKRFGCKNTLVVSVFSICPYVAANLYPHWGTLIPSAVLCGLAFGPLWAARSTYVNEISFQYSVYISGSIDVVNAWFFGIYSFFHENAEIWGNVISYFVLKPFNETDYVVSNETLATCGANFCNEILIDTNPNLIPPSYQKRCTLTVIFLALIVIAGFVIYALLDPLDKEESSVDQNSGISMKLFVATFKQLKNKDQLLLLPLTFYCGIADGFYNSDFTKAYIGCAWGISRVGFVTICYGVVSAVMDCSSGFLVKHLTRVPVFLIAAASHLAMLVAILLWKPTPDNSVVFFLLSGTYGLGASVWWSQITAFYGVIFKNNEEAAFSNFYFWSSLGLLVAYAYSNFLCTYVKIYILLVLLGIGIICYMVVDVKISCQSSKTGTTDKDSVQS